MIILTYYLIEFLFLLYNHECIVQTSFQFGNELFRFTPKNRGWYKMIGMIPEKIQTFVTKPYFFKYSALAQDILGNTTALCFAIFHLWQWQCASYWSSAIDLHRTVWHPENTGLLNHQWEIHSVQCWHRNYYRK